MSKKTQCRGRGGQSRQGQVDENAKIDTSVYDKVDGAKSKRAILAPKRAKGKGKGKNKGAAKFVDTVKGKE